MTQLKIDKKRDSKAASERLRSTVASEKEAGNLFAQKIKKDRPPRVKNLTVGVTQQELEFLAAQQTKTLSSPDYLEDNHNGRESTSSGNEASNIVRVVMELSKLMGNDDYRQWLPDLAEKFASDKE